MTSMFGGIALIVASAASIAGMLFGPRVGMASTGGAIEFDRSFADAQRRRAALWSGVRIERPYRSDDPGADRPRIWTDRVRDPATWRDLLWMLVNIPVGFVLGLLPAILLANGGYGVVVAPIAWAVAPGVVYWPIAIATGVAGLVVLWYAHAPILRLHARFSAALLGPTRRQLADRVGRLAASRAEVLDASAAELRRIERDLHDGTQARLVALGMTIGLAEQLVRTDPDAAVRLLAEARGASGEALAELRGLVRGIHPPVLAERGLDGAVRALVTTLPLPVDVDAALDGRLPDAVEAALYFAIVETLANVLKHSSATAAWVRLRTAPDRIVVTVGDDGRGGAGADETGGLAGIRRRLAAFDGTVAIDSPRGGPTTIAMEVPCAW
jgi:signal transduction histidine kinase